MIEFLGKVFKTPTQLLGTLFAIQICCICGIVYLSFKPAQAICPVSPSLDPLSIQVSRRYEEEIEKLQNEIQRLEEEVVFYEEPKTEKEQIIADIFTICKSYPNVDPYMIIAQVEAESTFNPKALSSSGEHVGLMQVSTRWHAERASKLCVTDMWDPYGNLLTGIDFMSELIRDTGSPALSLMIYNMGYVEPYKLLDQGIISDYAKKILANAETYRQTIR